MNTEAHTSDVYCSNTLWLIMSKASNLANIYIYKYI